MSTVCRLTPFHRTVVEPLNKDPEISMPVVLSPAVTNEGVAPQITGSAVIVKLT